MPTINFKNKGEIYTGAVSKANEYTDKKYRHTLTIIYAILIVVFLVFIQIVIDSFRFSSVTYKEYESRIEERSVLLKENKQLLEDIKLNQEEILQKFDK
jgi:hypothetical protein